MDLTERPQERELVDLTERSQERERPPLLRRCHTTPILMLSNVKSDAWLTHSLVNTTADVSINNTILST